MVNEKPESGLAIDHTALYTVNRYASSEVEEILQLDIVIFHHYR